RHGYAEAAGLARADGGVGDGALAAVGRGFEPPPERDLLELLGRARLPDPEDEVAMQIAGRDVVARAGVCQADDQRVAFAARVHRQGAGDHAAVVATRKPVAARLTLVTGEAF